MNSQSQVTGKIVRVSRPEPSRIARGTSGSEALSAAQASFPVGAVFVGNVSTNPETLLGFGTWTAAHSGKWIEIGAVDLYIWQRTA